jgi:glucose/arabinose dehydrogenase
MYPKKSISLPISALMLLTGLALLLTGINAWAGPRIMLEPIVSGLRNPVDINHAGDGSGRIFVVEQAGQIQIIKNGILENTPFLDIRDRVLTGSRNSERGLLGVAFHPEYISNGYFYVNYTSKSRAGVAGAGDTIIARYEVSAANPDLADPNSEAIVLHIEQPYSNHNAGKLLFSPIDGYLYIPLGDGGSGGDPENRSQDTSTLLGKVLRIDVDSDAPYAIPPDNPFIDDPDTRDEIWALGMRNPWRFSFDRLNGDMYLGDVGQGKWEEIDYQAAGSSGGINYGWRCREGAHNYNFSAECAELTLTDPIAEYGRDDGRSVTGGFVYRGAKYLALYGQYFYGDFITGRVWTIMKLGPNSWSEPNLARDTDHRISSFGEDESGELYLADREENNGTLYRIIDVCEGDFEDKGILDGTDVANVAADFFPSECDGDCQNDLNQDGLVNSDDLKVLAYDFGRTDCPN